MFPKLTLRVEEGRDIREDLRPASDSVRRTGCSPISDRNPLRGPSGDGTSRIRSALESLDLDFDVEAAGDMDSSLALLRSKQPAMLHNSTKRIPGVIGTGALMALP